MLLIVETGDDSWDEKEPRLLLARDEAEDDRRNEVLRLCGEKRAVMAWKREDCILMVGEDELPLFNDTCESRWVVIWLSEQQAGWLIVCGDVKVRGDQAY